MHEVIPEVKKQNSHLKVRQQRGSLSELHASVGGLLYVNEEWRDVKGYEGLYQVSNFGRVKSLDYYQKNPQKKSTKLSLFKEKVLKQCHDKDGYCYISLAKKEKAKTARVNRLVAQSFIPNPKNLPCTNHIDNDRTNNSIGNLEWVTVAENNKHRMLHGNQIRGESVNTNKLTEKEVLEIRELYKNSVDGRKYRNKKVKGILKQKDLAKKYNITPAQIYSITRRKCWKHI